MAKYRVVVRTVMYDLLTLEADNEAQIVEIVNGFDRDGKEVFQERHEAAWDSAKSDDGPDNGCGIWSIIPLTE